jgi:hypothetical protein
MDKVKQGAGQALTKAQQGVNQGKAKLDQAQAKHQWDGLLRDLGAAVYAEQRQGGPADAVTAALSALDEHVTNQGPADAVVDQGDGAVNEDEVPDGGLVAE